MSDATIADIRAFNRFYTNQIGLLDEHIVESEHSLSEARVLYELSVASSVTAAEIGRRLRLDRGYLSRMLQTLLARGLVSAEENPDDRRQTLVGLTEAGRKTVAGLNAGSDRAVAALLAPLTDEEQVRLREATLIIRRLLGDDLGTSAPIVLRPHRIGELGWLVHRQGLLYNQQLGWNGEFEALIARIYSEYAQAPDTPPKALWVADRQGEVVGSIFLTPHPSLKGTAQLRMLYVEPTARGSGLGTQLVSQCVDFARQSGYRRLRLWTQSVLVSARRIYAAAGFRMVESAPHHSFGQDLVGEYWELELQSQ
jgi:DNA-binding MarR family transcriptional regulator/GNAT superfamily N-acetyltransferase